MIRKLLNRWRRYVLPQPGDTCPSCERCILETLNAGMAGEFYVCGRCGWNDD